MRQKQSSRQRSGSKIVRPHVLLKAASVVRRAALLRQVPVAWAKPRQAWALMLHEKRVGHERKCFHTVGTLGHQQRDCTANWITQRVLAVQGLTLRHAWLCWCRGRGRHSNRSRWIAWAPRRLWGRWWGPTHSQTQIISWTCNATCQRRPY